MRKTNRAIVLPSVGDPLLLNFWDKCHQKNSRMSINKVYLKMTNPIDSNAKEFIVDKLSKSGYEVTYQDTANVHGGVLTDLIGQVQEETVVLLEDDFFVTHPGVLDEGFEAIESGQLDCIGSSRGCCSTRVVKAIANAFALQNGRSPEHQISDCPNFWPCLFYAKTETLRKTDGNYAAKHWPQGSTIPYINMVCDTEEVGDSFVWTSIQLRGQGNRFGYLHQHHTAPDDLVDYPRRTGLYSYNPIPWVHIGSLSSGIAGLLKYPNKVSLNNFSSDSGIPSEYPVVAPDSLMEYSRRIAMFKFIADYGKLEDPSLNYYNEIYANAVEQAINQMSLPRNIIAQFYETTKYIFGPTLEI